MSKQALGRLLGSGKVAEVFECGALVVKLYRAMAAKGSAFREASALAVAESLGLPVPSVQGVRLIDDRWGVLMARAEGPSFADAISREPAPAPAYLKAMALLQGRIHSQPGTQFASLKARLVANIRRAGMLGEARQRALLGGLLALPEAGQLCHGDFHPWNILGPPGQALVVDWLDACSGDPAADVCRSYVLIRPSAPELASAYVEAYAAASGVSRDRILGWLPFVAAARLAEDVPNEVDGLMEMVGPA
jgi:hypothetical protein